MRKTIWILLLALILSLLAACGAEKSPDEITSLAQLNEAGRKIGVSSDTAEDRLVAQELPNAKIEYFKDEISAYTSVSQGKIDAFVFLSMNMESAIYNGLKGVRLLDESLGQGNTGAVAISPVSKIPDLEGKINAFLREIRSDGTMDDIAQRWLVMHDETMPEIPSAEAADLHLVVGTTGSSIPFTYYVGTELAGYDIELARRFASWLGADLEFKVYDYEGIVAAALSGDVDCVFANLFITPEREEVIRFSEPTFVGRIGVMVRDAGAGTSTQIEAEYSTFEELNGKTVSMLTGAPFEELVRSKAPGVSEFTFFNNTPDMLLALKAGKTDAVLNNNAILALAVNRNPDLALFPQSLQDGVFGFAFAKGDPARDDWQAAYDTISEETKQALWEKWTGSDDSQKTLPEQDWPGLNGTVRVAACDTLEPMSYAGEGGTLMGFDIEMILTMAKTLDVHVEFTGMEFSAILASVQSGKADIGAGSIIVTQERAQAVDFVEYYPAAFVLIVRAKQAGYGAGEPITSFSDLENARIGATTGSVQVMQVEERFPDAELFYFSTTVDMLNALKANKIDALAEPEPIVKYMMTENPDLTYLDERLGDGMQIGAVFPKTDGGQALCDQFSAYVREIRQNGVYDEIQETWFGADESKRVVPDLYTLPATNGILRMAADTSLVPFVYIKDGKPVGLDIDTAVRFCKAYGYGLEVVPMDFSGIIPSVVTEKVDFACSGIAYTPERAQSVLYSEPTYESSSVIAVLKVQEAPTAEEEVSFWSDIASSFEKTFLRENRWQLFVDGVLTTLLITVLSILLGTALGFGIFMLCRNGNIVANGVTRFSVWLVQGMPMVVLLMILYYIIFGNVAISGIFVAVIGFTLTFGAAVFGMLKMGVGTIDRGQYEAAYALGHTNRNTFFKIILPQAIPHVLPAYQGEIVGLIKSTAIVGYIAVQDLTKMGDIVRSRTYEAFFPLIAITVIYFVLEGLFSFAVSRIRIQTDPKKRGRSRILKGVDIHD